MSGKLLSLFFSGINFLWPTLSKEISSLVHNIQNTLIPNKVVLWHITIDQRWYHRGRPSFSPCWWPNSISSEIQRIPKTFQQRCQRGEKFQSSSIVIKLSRRSHTSKLPSIYNFYFFQSQLNFRFSISMQFYISLDGFNSHIFCVKL